MSAAKDRLIHSIHLHTEAPLRGVKKFWRKLDHRARGRFANRERLIDAPHTVRPSEVFSMLVLGGEIEKAFDYRRRQAGIELKQLEGLNEKQRRAKIMAAVLP